MDTTTQDIENFLIETCDFKYIIKQMNLAFLNRKKTIVCEIENINFENYHILTDYLKLKGHKRETLLLEENFGPNRDKTIKRVTFRIHLGE